MAGSLTVHQARLVLPDRVVVGDLVVEDGIITEIGPSVQRATGLRIDGRGCVLLPGLVDTHVHLDACEDLGSMSRAAVAGGVTSVLGVRSARTPSELKAELAQAAELSRVHYGLYLRAHEDNLEQVMGDGRARGIWVSGQLLGTELAEQLFANTDRVLVVDNVLPERIEERGKLYEGVTDPSEHPRIHDEDSAVVATERALDLARLHGGPTHLLHVSSRREVDLLAARRSEHVTVGIPTPNLFLTEEAYQRLGTRAVASPPIRESRHQDALWEALRDGAADLIASGHHPVRGETKDRPYPGTHTGLPTVEWTLPLLLDAAQREAISLGEVARWTAERPAAAMRLPRKGRLETGYDADLVLVDLDAIATVGRDAPVRSACGWSPWQDRTLRGWPVVTIVLGEVVFRDGEVMDEPVGRAL
ncbi:MAG: amidohydrolase family protein [Myxococcales bacterium]|nr:amidohydrolase family protein [Myxococcales bacterium]